MKVRSLTPAGLHARIRRVKSQVKHTVAALPPGVRPANATVYDAKAGANGKFGNEVGPPWMGEWSDKFNDTFRNR